MNTPDKIVPGDINPPAQNTRDQVLGLESALASHPNVFDVDQGLTHHFAPGCYGRELFMPKDSIVVGKIHKHAHLNVLLEGKVSVVTEFGQETFEAPRIWISEPGVKRAVYNHEDTRWVTFHPTSETDLGKIEDEVIAPDFDTLDAFLEDKARAMLGVEDEA